METFLVFALLAALIAVAIGNTLVRRRRLGAAPDDDDLSFERILVPALGGPSLDRAVTLACKIARPDKASVEVLFVMEVPMSLPVTANLPEEDANAADAIGRSESIGRRFGVEVRGQVTKSRFAGKAIVDAAERDGVDLIVLGSSHKRHGDWGRTSEFVLRNAPCDVIIERSARS